MAVALFGVLRNGVFQGSLDRKLAALSLPPAVRTDIDRQRSRLAAIETDDSSARQAIKQSFVSGYRAILWVALALAIASSLSAAVLVSDKNEGT